MIRFIVAIIFQICVVVIANAQVVTTVPEGKSNKKAKASKQDREPAVKIPNQQTFSGFYKITLTDDKQEKRAGYVRLQRTGETVELTDLASKKTITGKIIRDAGGEFVRFEESGTTTPSWFVFGRRSEDDKMFARMWSGGQNFELQVEAVQTVWACSNHSNPTHTADTHPQMKDLTAKHGCSGWHKIDDEK